MRRFQYLLPVLCASLTLAPASSAQDRTPQIQEPEIGVIGVRKYHAPTVAPINLSNSNRFDALVRAGNLYLSLQDAISAGLENNLDIEIQRFGIPAAETDLQRAKAGGALRGVNQSVSTGPASAGGTLSL